MGKTKNDLSQDLEQEQSVHCLGSFWAKYLKSQTEQQGKWKNK